MQARKIASSYWVTHTKLRQSKYFIVQTTLQMDNTQSHMEYHL